MRWPGRVPAGGAIRPQFYHVIDVMPTHGMTAGLSCGEDRGHPVSNDYPRPGTFRGGRLRRVIVEVFDGERPAEGTLADVIALED